MLTGVVQTLVHICLTKLPRPTSETATDKGSYKILTNGAILTWTGDTLVYILITVGPGPSIETLTLVGPRSVGTTTVDTRVVGAFIDIDVTIASSPSRVTLAGIGSYRVTTGPVYTWNV